MAASEHLSFPTNAHAAGSTFQPTNKAVYSDHSGCEGRKPERVEIQRHPAWPVLHDIGGMGF